MTLYIRPEEGETSEMFLDAGENLGVGGSSLYCSCGIDHICTGYYLSEDEGEDFPEESEHVKLHTQDCVTGFEIDGKLFVTDCEGCKKKLRRYEDWIWNHRSLIRDYLKIRIDQEKVWADYEHTKNLLAGIG